MIMTSSKTVADVSRSRPLSESFAMSHAAPQPTGQKTTPPKSPESPSKLYQAIDEAQLLLAYAAAQAKELPDEQVEVIIQAKHLKERDKVTQSPEIKF